MHDTTHKRLFIGIPLDDSCQQQIDIALQPLRTREDIRWVPKQNRHLTLAFLGETSNDDLAKMQQDFANAYQTTHHFAFELKQLSRFPDLHGRIIAAVNTPSPALLALYEQTRTLLQGCDIPFEEREYRPHITLGRIKHAKQVKADFQQPLSLLLQVNSVNLFESAPTDAGREYRVLQQTHFLL